MANLKHILVGGDFGDLYWDRNDYVTWLNNGRPNNEIEQVINLSISHLTDEHVFLNFPNLSRLDIVESNFNITKINDLPSTIKVLNLSNNGIEQIPPSINRFHSLEILDLSRNRLYSVPSEIGELHNLEELELNNNRISNLPDSLTNIQSLQYVGVHLNPISSQHIPPLLISNGVARFDDVVVDNQPDTGLELSNISIGEMSGIYEDDNDIQGNDNLGFDEEDDSMSVMSLTHPSIFERNDEIHDNNSIIGINDGNSVESLMVDDAVNIFDNNSNYDSFMDEMRENHAQSLEQTFPLKTEEEHLGILNNNIPLISSTIYDPISMDNTNIRDFLQINTNIMVYMNNNWSLVDRNRISSLVSEVPNSNIVYPCNSSSNEYLSENVDLTRPFFKVQLIDGVSERSFVLLTQINSLMNETHQFYTLAPTDENLLSTVSRSVYLGQVYSDTAMYGASHCQEGHGGKVYVLKKYGVERSSVVIGGGEKKSMCNRDRNRKKGDLKVLKCK